MLLNMDQVRKCLPILALVLFYGIGFDRRSNRRAFDGCGSQQFDHHIWWSRAG